MKLPIPLEAYDRNAGFLPNIRVRNLIVEKTPADDENVILLPRPGMTLAYSIGPNPVKAVWTQPGIFNNAPLSLSGSSVYLGSSAIGALSSPAVSGARFAASDLEAVFSNNGVLYRTDGVSVTKPAFPDGAAVSAVAILDGYFLAIRQDTSKVYWSNINDGTTWPALNFASAEARPDNAIDIMAVNDQIAIIGQESIEFWQPNPSGSANLPFTRIDGLTYSKGALNTGAAAYADNTLLWVGNDGVVYRRGAVPQRISDHGIEEQIKLAGTAQLFTFNWVGHVLLVLSLPNSTWYYDFATQFWGELSTTGFNGWRVGCGTANGIVPYFGDSSTGQLLTIDDNALFDAGAIVERRFSAMIPGQVIVDNLWLDAQGGIGSEPNGDPILVEVSMSRDGSQTWGPYLQTNLGKRGEYRKRACWRRLGRYDMGVVFDFRTTDPALFSVQSVMVNEPVAGRGV